MRKQGFRKTFWAEAILSAKKLRVLGLFVFVEVDDGCSYVAHFCGGPHRLCLRWECPARTFYGAVFP
jgi:hypothetical protein